MMILRYFFFLFLQKKAYIISTHYIFFLYFLLLFSKSSDLESRKEHKGTYIKTNVFIHHTVNICVENPILRCVNASASCTLIPGV